MVDGGGDFVDVAGDLVDVVVVRVVVRVVVGIAAAELVGVMVDVVAVVAAVVSAADCSEGRHPAIAPATRTIEAFEIIPINGSARFAHRRPSEADGACVAVDAPMRQA